MGNFSPPCPIVIGRCHGVSRLADRQPRRNRLSGPPGASSTTRRGFVPVDVKYLPQMADEEKQVLYNRYYERFTEFCDASKAFLSDLTPHEPRIRTLLTENLQIVG